MSVQQRTPKWFGTVSDDGKAIKLVFPEQYRRYLARLKGQFVTLIVMRRQRRRSNQQNNYWWSVVVPAFADACHYAAHEHEAVHDELIRLLVGMRPDAHPALPIRVSSADLSTLEFNRLIEAAQILAADKLGIVIEDPDPEWAWKKAKARKAPAHMETLQ